MNQVCELALVAEMVRREIRSLSGMADAELFDVCRHDDDICRAGDDSGGDDVSGIHHRMMYDERSSA